VHPVPPLASHSLLVFLAAIAVLLAVARLLGRLAWMMDFGDEAEEEERPDPEPPPPPPIVSIVLVLDQSDGTVHEVPEMI